MYYILNIETATTVCSVSISKDNELLAFQELDNGFTHAENLHVFIKSVLGDAGLNLSEINAIAVSKGPGSYTGLRIGASTAKGLSYALKIPLISIDTLQIMTIAAQFQKNESALYCPMIDARRMEVYTSLYTQELLQQSTVEALIVDEESIEKFNSEKKIYFFGDGMQKCKTLLSQLENAGFIDGIVPSAKHMPTLALKKFNEQAFEDVAYFEPFYLKDFLILKKKEK